MGVLCIDVKAAREMSTSAKLTTNRETRRHHKGSVRVRCCSTDGTPMICSISSFRPRTVGFLLATPFVRGYCYGTKHVTGSFANESYWRSNVRGGRWNDYGTLTLLHRLELYFLMMDIGYMGWGGWICGWVSWKLNCRTQSKSCSHINRRGIAFLKVVVHALMVEKICHEPQDFMCGFEELLKQMEPRLWNSIFGENGFRVFEHIDELARHSINCFWWNVNCRLINWNKGSVLYKMCMCGPQQNPSSNNQHRREIF